MDIQKVLSMTSEDRLRLIECGVLEKEDVHYLLSCGKLHDDEMEAVRNLMAKKRYEGIKKYVKRVHPYAIIAPSPCMKKPRFRTYIRETDPATGKTRRREVSRTYESDLYVWLYEYYSGSKAVDIFPSVVTLTSLYPEWFEYKKTRTKADSNLLRVDYTWRKYYADTEIACCDLVTLTPLQLDVWIHKMIRIHNMDRRKYNNFILVLRQMLRYAVLRDLLAINPLDKVDINTNLLFVRDVPEDETQVFTFEEENEVVALAWEDYRTNKKLRFPLACLAVVFQFITGLRIGELCALKYSDIRGDHITIQRMVSEQYTIVDRTKSRRSMRKVLLTEEALDIIDETVRFHEAHDQGDAEYIFGDYEHLLPRTVTDRYARYCKTLGITHRSSHKARKTYVTKLFEAGVNPRTISRITGHDIGVMMQNYTFDRAEALERDKIIAAALPAHTGVRKQA